MSKSPASDPNARLEAALAERGFADPRPALRERLRGLRDSNPAAFEEAKKRFEHIVQNSDDPADALDPWIDYGRYLGDLSGEGRLFRIDETGRGTPYSPPMPAGAMLLHLPDTVSVPALAVVLPANPSPAQQATYDLLVGRQLSISFSS